MGEAISAIFIGIVIILVSGFFIVLYMLPYILSRGKSFSSGLFWFNLLFGWSFIGWIIALVWAVSEDKSNPAQNNQPMSTDAINALESLGQLRTQGYISVSEYNQQKQNLLANNLTLASNINALARLGRLYEQNLITYQEFTQQKQKTFGNTINKSTTSLETLKRLHREGLITDQEYLDKKSEIDGNSINSSQTNQADYKVKNDPKAKPYNPSSNS